MRDVSTDRAPCPAGGYSQAVIDGTLVYLSGQLPKDPATGFLVGGSPAEQTRWAMDNLAAVLEAAGSDLHHLLKVNIQLRSVGDWDQVNAAYTPYVNPACPPARTVMAGLDIHGGAAVEIDAIARLKEA